MKGGKRQNKLKMTICSVKENNVKKHYKVEELEEQIAP